MQVCKCKCASCAVVQLCKYFFYYDPCTVQLALISVFTTLASASGIVLVCKCKCRLNILRELCRYLIEPQRLSTLKLKLNGSFSFFQYSFWTTNRKMPTNTSGNSNIALPPDQYCAGSFCGQPSTPHTHRPDFVRPL